MPSFDASDPRFSSGQPLGQPSYMFPNLHDNVAASVSSDARAPEFNRDQCDPDYDKEYTTNITGTFVCPNKRCKTLRWASRHVAIVIRLFTNDAYNAVVYNQKCKACNCLGTMHIDTSVYVAWVSYRLKRWAGVFMEPPPFPRKDRPP